MIVAANALSLPLTAASVQCVVTSPPYWGLRDYGHGQLGLESTPEEYVANMVEVFREVRRVLKDDGTVWLNLGDSYAAALKGSGGVGKGTLNCGARHNAISTTRQMMGTRKYEHGVKPKDLVGIPWRVAFALQADGWYLRSDIIWSKPNPMPESVTDRPTKAHEYLFLLTKAARYYYDADAIAERTLESSLARCEQGFVTSDRDRGTEDAQIGAAKRQRYGLREEFVAKDTRNARSVWTATTQPYSGAHFAVMPEQLVVPCVKAGSRPADVVLDPFCGSGTVGVVAQRYERRFVGCDLSRDYLALATSRLAESYAPSLW